LLFQTSRVRTQKKEVVFSDSLAGKGRRQKEKGRSYLSAHRPTCFILPFAFLLLPSEKLRGKGRRQKEKGRSYLSAHQPNFFILPFAFLLFAVSLHPPVERERINSCMTINLGPMKWAIWFFF
jgi:hypothetical protein